MRKVILLGVALACACFSGCKSEDAEPISQADLPSAAAHAVCDSFGSCCSKASFTFDSTNCVAAATAKYQQVWAVGNSANFTYDAQAAGDCLAAFKAVAHCGQAESSDNTSCDKIIVGKLTAGQPCTSSAECAEPANGDASCDEDATGAKVCMVYTPTPVTRGTEGQACSFDCAEASSCSIFSSPGSAPGTTPTAAVACYRSEGLFCDAGTCAKLHALGQACPSSNSCIKGSFCDNSTSRCTAPHPNGAMCASDSECQSDNCSDAVCGGAQGVTQAECAAGDVD